MDLNDITEDRRAEIERKVRQRVALEKKAFDFIRHLSLADSVTEEELIEIILKQKYKISLRNKTVYDLTERKKFCSNQCFEASKHFQKQISETPVWAREAEVPVTFTVLHKDETRVVFARGRNGDIAFENPRTELAMELKGLSLNDDAQVTTAESSVTSDDGQSDGLEKELSSETIHEVVVDSKVEPKDTAERIEEKAGQAKDTLNSSIRAKSEKTLAATNVAQSASTLSEKLKFIKEWRTSRTVDFFRPAAICGPSDYGRQVSQFYSSNQKADDETNVRLAAVDHRSQHTQRMKIVLERLSHVWPKLEILLRVNLTTYREDLRNLVSTFEFSNKNILFKPVEWLLVGYILLRMLNERSKQLFNDQMVQMDLGIFSINEEEIAEVVNYMTSCDDMDAVD